MNDKKIGNILIGFVVGVVLCLGLIIILAIARGGSLFNMDGRYQLLSGEVETDLVPSSRAKTALAQLLTYVGEKGDEPGDFSELRAVYIRELARRWDIRPFPQSPADSFYLSQSEADSLILIIREKRELVVLGGVKIFDKATGIIYLYDIDNLEAFIINPKKGIVRIVQ